MTRSRILLTLSFVGVCLVGGTAAIKPPVAAHDLSFIRPKSTTVLSFKNHKVLEIRGGGGGIVPFDSDAVAKASILLQVVNAAYIAAFPSQATEAYGAPVNASNKLMVESLGFALVTYAVDLYMMYFQKEDLTYAAGVGSVFLFLQGVKGFLTQASDDGASSPTAKWAQLVCGGLMAFAGLTRADYAGTLLKVLTVTGALSGLQMLLDPAGCAKTWKFASAGPNHTSLTRACGAFILSYSAYRVLIMRGMDVKTAFGWSILLHTVYTAGTFFGVFEEGKTMSFNKPAYLVWGCIHLFTAASMLL